MMNKSYLNPSMEQERQWQAQRLAALASTQASVDKVMRLATKAERRQFLAGYREKWGPICADALEAMVRKRWDKGHD